MEFQNNQVVKLRNGKFGVVASFNEKPFQLVFTAFTTPIRRYDENFKNANNDYDVVAVYDGSKLAVVTDVFKKNFNPSGLDLVWERQD